MEKDSLEFLAQRLESIESAELQMAAELVRSVIASKSRALQQPDAEHALFHAVWDHVTRALDHDEFDSKHIQQVHALESEMAGQVLTHRLRRGWISSTKTGPTEFRHIDEFL